MRTRRKNLLCNGCVKDRVQWCTPLCTFAERNGRYFAKLKREPHAIQARAYARMRQTRARILHVSFLFYTHLSCSLTEKFRATHAYPYRWITNHALLLIRSLEAAVAWRKLTRWIVWIYIYISNDSNETRSYHANISTRKEKGFDSPSIPPS